MPQPVLGVVLYRHSPVASPGDGFSPAAVRAALLVTRAGASSSFSLPLLGSYRAIPTRQETRQLSHSKRSSRVTAGGSKSETLFGQGPAFLPFSQQVSTRTDPLHPSKGPVPSSDMQATSILKINVIPGCS